MGQRVREEWAVDVEHIFALSSFQKLGLLSNRSLHLFQPSWLLSTPYCLFWSESVAELVKQTKRQQRESCESIHTNDWPDVPWNAFPKLLLDWLELTCSKNYNEMPGSKPRGLGKVSRHLAASPSHLVQKRAVLQQLGLIEVRPHSHHKQTTPEFTGKCTETTSSRISRHVCLLCFWCAPECDWHIHTYPNEPHQGGKQTGLWFNQNEVGMTAPWERFSPLQTADQEKPYWHYCREVGSPATKKNSANV